MDETVKQIYREIAQCEGDISLQKLEKALHLLKELKKRQCREEHETQITELEEELFSFTAGHVQGQNEIRERTEKILDKVQNMAFMEGYQYAVAILEESMLGAK